MGGVVYSENSTHRTNIANAERTRQAAIAGTPSQATVNAAELAYARSVYASAVANNCDTANASMALKALGFNS